MTRPIVYSPARRIRRAAGSRLTTTYVYDGEGRFTDVTEPSGRLTRTSYDRDGRVTQVAIDPSGLNLRTTYSLRPAGQHAHGDRRFWSAARIRAPRSTPMTPSADAAPKWSIRVHGKLNLHYAVQV